MHWIAHVVREFLVRWGYLALMAGLMGENAGLPLPGETVLMYSSFLARKSDGMSLMLVILVGVTAAIVGDNVGFLIGRHFGPRLLNWLKRHFHLDTQIAAATDQIHRHGGATIFWARFIFGLRTVAGPVAGALGMRWKRFAFFNALGAVCWVLAISLTAYAWPRSSIRSPITLRRFRGGSPRRSSVRATTSGAAKRNAWSSTPERW